MELRSPCGGAIGQMAYYHNGKVYSCDEARMLAEMGDDSFCLGNVYKDSYNDLMSSSVCKVLARASCWKVCLTVVTVRFIHTVEHVR